MSESGPVTLVCFLDDGLRRDLVAALEAFRKARGLQAPTDAERAAIVERCEHILALGYGAGSLCEGVHLPDVVDDSVQLYRPGDDLPLNLGDTAYLHRSLNEPVGPRESFTIHYGDQLMLSALASLHDFRRQRGRPAATAREKALLIAWCEAARAWEFGVRRGIRGRWLIDVLEDRLELYEPDRAEPLALGDPFRVAQLSRMYSRMN
jgi:hypothetical protein